MVQTARRGAPEEPRDQLRILAFIAISGLFGGLVFTGATIALPKLLAERLPGAGLVLVGVIAALIFGAAAFAQLPVGRLLDRWGARPLLFAIEGVKAPLLLAMALTPGGGSAALALPVMLLVFGEIPITAWLLGRHLGERWWSRAYSVQYLLSLGVAAGTVPLITALYRQTGDQTALFVVLAACSATILAMHLPRPGHATTAPLPTRRRRLSSCRLRSPNPRGAPTMDRQRTAGHRRAVRQAAPARPAGAAARRRGRGAYPPAGGGHAGRALLHGAGDPGAGAGAGEPAEPGAGARARGRRATGGAAASWAGCSAAASRRPRRRGMAPMAQGPIPQQYMQPGAGGAPGSPWGRPAGGGFLAGAMQTALGVAGGMLIADALTSAFDSGTAEAGELAQDAGLVDEPVHEPIAHEEPAYDDGGMGGDGFDERLAARRGGTGRQRSRPRL